MIIHSFKKVLFVFLFSMTLILVTNHQSNAETLEVVFKNSIWGAGIGATLGVASWFLTEEKMAKDLWFGVLKGSALGALFGIGYGVLEKEGAFSDARKIQDGTYLVEWNQKKKLITIDSSSTLNLLVDADQNKFRLGLLRVSF